MNPATPPQIWITLGRMSRGKLVDSADTVVVPLPQLLMPVKGVCSTWWRTHGRGEAMHQVPILE